MADREQEIMHPQFAEHYIKLGEKEAKESSVRRNRQLAGAGKRARRELKAGVPTNVTKKAPAKDDPRIKRTNVVHAGLCSVNKAACVNNRDFLIGGEQHCEVITLMRCCVLTTPPCEVQESRLSMPPPSISVS